MSEIISKQLVFGKMVEEKQVSTTSINVKVDSSSSSVEKVSNALKGLMNGEYNIKAKSIFSLGESNNDGDIILNKLVATSLNSKFKNIEDIIIPSSINMNDGSLKNVVKAVSIGDEPLINNALSQKAKTVTFKDGIKEIEGKVISSSTVEQIIFADTITVLDDKATNGCINIKYIKYPRNYVEIPFRTFASSTMSEFTVSDNINKIGSYAFYKSLVKTVNLNNVENINHNAFEDCKNLNNIDLRKVKIINHYAFKDCIGLTEVYLDDIETLVSDSFYGATNLSKIVLGDKITKLEENCLRGTTGLLEITIPNTIKTIGYEPFGSNHNTLEKIYVVAPNPNIFNKLKENKNFADRLIYVSEDGEVLPNPSEEYVWGEYYPIEDEIDKITEYTDDYTEWEYEEDTENEDCVILGDMTMKKMNYYEEHYGEIEQMLIVPNKLRLEDGSIKKVKKIKSDIGYMGAVFTRIIICEGIEEGLNKGLDGLWGTKVKIPTTLKKVGEEGLINAWCDMLDLVNIETLGIGSLTNAQVKKIKMTKVKNLPTKCFDRADVKNIVLGNIETISANCFENNKKLETIEIDSVKSIGNSAFYNCTLIKKIDLKGIESVGSSVFSGCSSLTDINVYAPSIDVYNTLKATYGSKVKYIEE